MGAVGVPPSKGGHVTGMGAGQDYVALGLPHRRSLLEEKRWGHFDQARTISLAALLMTPSIQVERSLGKQRQ